MELFYSVFQLTKQKDFLTSLDPREAYLHSYPPLSQAVPAFFFLFRTNISSTKPYPFASHTH